MSSSSTTLSITQKCFLFGSWEIKTSFKNNQSSLWSKSVYSFTKLTNIPGNYSCSSKILFASIFLVGIG